MKSLGFIGAGQIGGTFIGGMKKFSPDTECCYYEISPARCREVEVLYSVTTEKSIAAVMEKSDIPFITVIPQVFPNVASGIAKNYHKEQIIISALAGIGLEEIAAYMPEGAKIARMMPNMALEFGAGTG